MMDKLVTNKKIFLASSSPRRIEMFADGGVNAEVVKPSWEERLTSPLTVEQTVMYLALQKALSAEKEIREQGAVVIGADTVVYKDVILGKPKDREDAFRMFESLRNTSHQVLTGVAILEVGGPRRRVFYQSTEVVFRDYTKDDVAAYLDTGEPWDKAGGYAIQGGWGKYIDHIVGDRDNVIGFPWALFRETFRSMFHEK
ncbi:MAG: septum formation protein Maf [Clostridiales bacterium]|nr:septum formation protein Maf [Clostridiales bacterium]